MTPQLAAESERLSAERARWFGIMQGEVRLRRFASPLCRQAEATRQAVFHPQQRLAMARGRPFADGMQRRGWAFTHS